ncbi:hypothetical protein HDEF_0661 [Candidatus Hamiltonella defensa 5AT (Acyrthosiphon pisum)]|uniref:Uncharacterized protein n=1 Tax=Hamiltonella defensa subsp. Acyrthosiphon pisum (strain 5AT) TaxID=572265 RepID=C4K4A8_HAMD5|nr:hypothetical protein HDEF_0661 [Candidatus Hamiltonella defensa 5AT (Acyrthosiphon pisum)]
MHVKLGFLRMIKNENRHYPIKKGDFIKTIETHMIKYDKGISQTGQESHWALKVSI